MAKSPSFMRQEIEEILAAVDRLLGQSGATIRDIALRIASTIPPSSCRSRAARRTTSAPI